MGGGTVRERRQRRNLEGSRAAQHENTVFRKQRHSLGAGRGITRWCFPRVHGRWNMYAATHTNCTSGVGTERSGRMSAGSVHSLESQEGHGEAGIQFVGRDGNAGELPVTLSGFSHGVNDGGCGGDGVLIIGRFPPLNRV